MFLGCRYKGRLYDTCITHGNNGVPWCSTSVDDQGVHLDDSIKSECPNDTCNINNCPVGFSWLVPTETCYQVNGKELWFFPSSVLIRCSVIIVCFRYQPHSQPIRLELKRRGNWSAWNKEGGFLRPGLQERWSILKNLRTFISARTQCFITLKLKVVRPSEWSMNTKLETQKEYWNIGNLVKEICHLIPVNFISGKVRPSSCIFSKSSGNKYHFYFQS